MRLLFLYGWILLSVLGAFVWAPSQAHATADLYVDSLQVPKAPIIGGKVTSIRLRVVNRGGISARNVGIYIYLSSDATITTKDTRIHLARLSILYPRRAKTFTLSFRLSLQVKAGNYWLGAFVDPLNLVRESNESNNTTSAKVQVKQTPLPDLTPLRLQLSQYTIPASGDLDISFTIFNQGLTRAPAHRSTLYISTNAWITTKDTKLQDLAIPSIAAGKSHTHRLKLKLPSQLAPGVFYLGLMVDRSTINSFPPGDVQELTESNNIRYVRFVVTAPDLVITSLLAIPDTLQVGKTAKIGLAVYNQGAVKSVATEVGLFLSQTKTLTSNVSPVITGIVPALEAKKTAQLTLQLKVTQQMLQKLSAPYHLIGVVDHKNTVRELSEKNNSRQTILGGKGIDLIPWQVQIPTLAAREQEVEFRFLVRNHSTVTAQASLAAIYYSVDTRIGDGRDIRLKTIIIQSLPGHTQQAYSTKVKIPKIASLSSIRYLGVIVDSAQKISELDETNNSAYAPFKVGHIDFVTTSFRVAPLAAKEREKVKASFTIRNQGTLNAPSSVAAIYFSPYSRLGFSSKRLLEVNIPKLDKGSSFTHQTTIEIPSGLAGTYYYFIIKADSKDQVTEPGSFNNYRIVRFQLKNDVDLEVGQLQLPSKSIEKGKATPLKITIKNNGKSPSGRVIHKIYYSTDKTLDAKDIPTSSLHSSILKGFAKSTLSTFITLPSTVPDGNGFLLVKVDDGNQLIEANENNNLYTHPILVTPNSSTVPPTEHSENITDGGPPESQTPPENPRGLEKDECYLRGCPQGLRCVKGFCEFDPCYGKTCQQSDTFCREGQCIKSCAKVQCLSGQRCRDGQCENDPCSGVTCQNHQICQKGQCLKDLCSNMSCGKGRMCENGVCIDDMCANIICPNVDEICSKGQCTKANKPINPKEKNEADAGPIPESVFHPDGTLPRDKNHGPLELDIFIDIGGPLPEKTETSQPEKKGEPQPEQPSQDDEVNTMGCQCSNQEAPSTGSILFGFFLFFLLSIRQSKRS